MARNVTCTEKHATPRAGTGSSEQVLLRFVYQKEIRHLMQGRVCRIRPQISLGFWPC